MTIPPDLSNPFAPSTQEKKDLSSAGLQGICVALVLNDLHLGGSERQALLLARELARYGVHPVLLGLAGPGPIMELAKDSGITCDATALKFPLSPWYFPFNLLRAAKLFRKYHPQVILSYTSVPNLYGGWLWRLIGARLFVWGQRDDGLYQPPPLLLGPALRSTPSFVANAPSNLTFLTRDLKVNPSKVHWIPNAVEIPAKPVNEIRPPLTPLRVIHVANGRPPKDHETLLQAWQEIQQIHSGNQPTPLLTLVGNFDRGHAYAARIQDLATKTDLASSVQFTGISHTVTSQIQASDIGVLSSTSEGLPNAVLEYMASGLPVVATDLPGIRHALGSDSTHWLTPPGDSHTLALRIKELLDNPDLRLELGRKNRLRATTLFSTEALGRSMIEIIKNSIFLPISK